MHCDLNVFYATQIIWLYGMSSDEDEDYSVTPPGVYEATFPSGSEIGSTACDTITIVDDSALEGLHDLGFSIIGASVGGTSLSGVAMSQFTNVEIEDNEGMKHCYWLLMTMFDDVFTYCNYMHLSFNVCKMILMFLIIPCSCHSWVQSNHFLSSGR